MILFLTLAIAERRELSDKQRTRHSKARTTPQTGKSRNEISGSFKFPKTWKLTGSDVAKNVIIDN